MIEPSVGVNPVMPGWPGFVSAYPYGLLSQTVAPTIEPLTLDEAKQHCRVYVSDDDAYLTALIQVAREFVEGETERALLPQTFVLFLDSFPWWRAPIMVPRPPCKSVASIKYYDQDGVLQTWDSSNYLVVAPAGPTAQQAQVVPAAGVSWPLLPSSALTQRRPDAVQVTFQAGWDDAASVPAALKAAMKLLIENLYGNRSAAQIVRGSADTLPYGVDNLLARFRVVVY